MAQALELFDQHFDFLVLAGRRRSHGVHLLLDLAALGVARVVELSLSLKLGVVLGVLRSSKLSRKEWRSSETGGVHCNPPRLQ